MYFYQETSSATFRTGCCHALFSLFLQNTPQIISSDGEFHYKLFFGQPIYKLTTPAFSCFDTWLIRYSWIFFCTSSKCRKKPANLASQLLAVFVAVQKVSWLSTRPEAVLVWHRCLAAMCRGHPTWGPGRSQPRVNETVGNTSHNCIKIWTWRKKRGFILITERLRSANLRRMWGKLKTPFTRGLRSTSCNWGISLGTSRRQLKIFQWDNSSRKNGYVEIYSFQSKFASKRLLWR